MSDIKLFKEYSLLDSQGMITLDVTMENVTGDLGIQIAEDGRVWICINGQSHLRFRPFKSGFDEKFLKTLNKKE